MNMVMKVIMLLAFSIAPGAVLGATLNIVPEKPLQGEPLMISVDTVSDVQSISFDNRSLGIFLNNGKQSALYGIDLYKAPGSYKVKAKLADGSVIERDVVVEKRKKINEVLGIPEKLGGNTAAGALALVNTLASENASLLNLRTGRHAFWTKPFQFPVKTVTVTDPYGYVRSTGSYEISHKGTDFRAPEGTPVLAMNRGVVRIAREGRNYGKTIVIDHGFGVQTLYMHLSKINVKVGELVLPGQVIGLAGSTGYAESAHLHLSVRIRDVSVDPMKFMEIFSNPKI